VPIVDAALYVPNSLNLTDSYPPYTRGNDSNVFLNNVDGDQYIGAVWPGYTAFTDFRAPKSQSWWTNELEIWHNNVAYDGIWIDMSEIDSFCIGSCGTGHVQENPVHPPNTLPGELGNIIYAYPEDFGSTNSLNQSEWQSAQAGAASQSAYLSSKSHSASATAMMTVTSTSYLVTKPTGGVRNVTYPPYVINNSNGALGGQALSPDAVHADGTQEYDTHNTYGAEIIKATYNGLQSVFPGKRPFIIARSNFAGSGSFAGHWGGDNNAQWLYMYYSIPQALSHSLFGFPMFGVDTCGFRGNTDEGKILSVNLAAACSLTIRTELCNRWMQLSAFFPFYRNHNQLSDIPQEPYRKLKFSILILTTQ
jgi:alpha-glucosidase